MRVKSRAAFRRRNGAARTARAATRARFAGTAALAVSMALLGAAGYARAHPELVPEGTGCFLTIIVPPIVPDDARVALELSLAIIAGPGAALELRRAADANGDGQLDAHERAAAVEAWRRLAPSLFRVVLDGAELAPDYTGTLDLGGSTAVESRPVSVQMGAVVAVAVGPHRLRVEPAREPPRLMQTEIALDLARGWQLEASGRDAARAARAARADDRPDGTLGPVTLFRFAGGRTSVTEDRAVTFAFSPAVAPAAAARVPHSPAVAVLALLAAVALGLVHANGLGSSTGPARAGARAAWLVAHATFPATVGALLAFARARAGVDVGRAAHVALALGAMALALLGARPRGERLLGHSDERPIEALVPGATALALTALAALTTPAVALGAALAYLVPIALPAAESGAGPGARWTTLSAAATTAAAIMLS